MTKKKAEAGRKRTGFSPEFRQQALLRAATEGVPAVAHDLGLQPAQLYAWRAKAQRLAQLEQARLRREVARLEEEVAFLKKAAAYFAKQPK